MITKYLSENRNGIYLTSPQGKLISSGEKTLIIQNKNYKEMVNIPLYLIEDNLCYGVIKLEEPKLITLQEFKELQDKHKITDEERQKLWSSKEILFSYSFEILKTFPEPIPIIIPKTTQTFVENIEFLQEGTTAAISGGTPTIFNPITPVTIDKKKEIELEEISKELNVVQRGDRWCVVHGHPMTPGSKTDKPIGTVIKCFPTKEEAIAMHKAIIISEAKRKDMSEINLIDSIYSEIEEVIKNLP